MQSRKQWTAVIPAAGKGTRLSQGVPKILCLVGGKPVLSWLVEALKDAVSEIILVLSPGGFNQVVPHLSQWPGLITTVIQQEPKGMAHAVLVSEHQVKTPFTLVLWGDQVTVRESTIQACQFAHARREKAQLTLPTVMRETPYVNIVRNNSGRIIRVDEVREKGRLNGVGEADCGLFCFTTVSLFQILREARQKNLGVGAKTKEFNLLPLLPLFDNGDQGLATLQIADSSETLGINSADDVTQAEVILRERFSL